MQCEENAISSHDSPSECASWKYWRLCSVLTVKQAALLIAGEDPSALEEDIEERRKHERPPAYEPAKVALKEALKQNLVEGTIVREFNSDDYGQFAGQIPDSVDIELSTVKPESVKKWLEQLGFRRGFFFPDPIPVPEYLDHRHPCYSPKLHAAIAAWTAVVSDPKYAGNGKTVKQNLESYVLAHAAEFDLVKDDGEINFDAIRNQIAKVANWNEKGGAPKTPEKSFTGAQVPE